jgi:riboflavin-specific deaminase-like protein
VLSQPDVSSDEARAFLIVTELVRDARRGYPLTARTGFRVSPDGRVGRVPEVEAWVWVDPSAEPGFGSIEVLSPAVERLFKLFLPLCFEFAGKRLAIGHLGQSLDGQIATSSGASRYVTGPENLQHVHRLRALCDAVVVGKNTLERDDPQLTTRLVPGRNPVRVVIDPHLRALAERRLFLDGAAPTWVVCSHTASLRAPLPSGVELVRLHAEAERLAPRAILDALAERGQSWVLVEGGGVTVSRFIEARALDRLHLAIAPVILGRGRAGLELPAVDEIAHALRLRATRFELGDDVLFDCRFDGKRSGPPLG